MFRFWTSDPRGREQTVADATLPMPLFAKPVQAYLDSTAPRPSFSPDKLKRRRSITDHAPVTDFSQQPPLPPKRPKIETGRPQPDGGRPPAAAATPRRPDADAPPKQEPDVPVESAAPQGQAVDGPSVLKRAKDVIQFQFGLEILHKHEELRLINQELAKCQIALEQLRRCHLIPYPVTCPTPEQMLDISSGKGPAVRSPSGAPVPEWAPPFGVVDGPYARHYAKWLIPDPKFDGVLPDWQGLGPQPAAPKSSVEGRTTRNSYGETASLGKSRQARGVAVPKLQSLSNGYPQPKDKSGPCILKRSDGKTVKLVCIDCHRENFSSTQGFINHCRIAHRRDFKSHEEAAVRSGHPIEVDEAATAVAEERPGGAGPSPSTPATGLVHPLARNDTAEVASIATLKTRVKAVLQSYESNASHLASAAGASVKPSPTVKSEHSSSFVGSADAPHLSRLLKGKNFGGDLAQHVADAKTKEDLSDVDMADEDSEGGEPAVRSPKTTTHTSPAAVRTPVVMRVPARAGMTPASARPSSSKTSAPLVDLHTPLATPTELSQLSSNLYDDEMDVDMSPNTMASNNAPSLVSDDGEYDDSDDGSSSDVSDAMDTDSVTEIKLEDDHEVQDHMTPRAMRKGGGGLKKDESRHVTFVSPVRATGKRRRRKQEVQEIIA